jgi:transposase-like protein
MPRGSNFRKPYPPEFRREAVELYRTAGKSLNELAADLGVSTETLRIWVKQADVDADRREGLSSEERRELRELRRKVKTLEQEREILKEAASSSRGRARRGDGVPVHRGGEDRLPDLADVPDAWGVSVGLSCLGAAAAVGSRPGR